MRAPKTPNQRRKNSSRQKKLELAHLSHHFLSYYIDINEQFHLANADPFKYLGDRVEDRCPNKWAPNSSIALMRAFQCTLGFLQSKWGRICSMLYEFSTCLSKCTSFRISNSLFNLVLCLPWAQFSKCIMLFKWVFPILRIIQRQDESPEPLFIFDNSLNAIKFGSRPEEISRWMSHSWIPLYF